MHLNARYNRKISKMHILRATLLIGAATVSNWGVSAQGQDAGNTSTEQQGTAAASNESNPSLTEIIVTGSRIRRAGFDTIQPAEVLGADEISKRGYTNLGNALQELPAFSVPANSPIGTQGSFGAGQTFANMYNLGSQRTLVLVDGKRFVSSATSSIFGSVAGSPVDLSSIPTVLVDRTEVVAVGGAPIYGSDAIAGTVNIILKKDYQGADVDVQSGLSEKGDAADYNISAVVGQNFDNNRGNITLSAQYDKQNGLTTDDRFNTGGDRYFFGTSTKGSPFRQQLYSDGRHYNIYTNTGMPLSSDDYPIRGGKTIAAITNAAGQPLYFSPSGQLIPFVNGQLTGNSLYQAGGSGFAISDYGNLLAESSREQVTVLGHYDITDHLHFSGEFWYGHTSAANLRAQPYYSTAQFANAGQINGNLIMQTSNPYLSNADRATIINNLAAAGADTSTFYLTRANTDLSSGAFRTTSDLYRGVAGLNGDFSLGHRDFDWEVTGTYGKSLTTTESHELVTQNFYNALNATTDVNGNIICAPGSSSAAIATLSATCAPLNIFGINKASRAALNYITAIARPTQDNAQYDVVADFNSKILHLPGGDAKYSLGYEYRRETTDFNPGAFYYGQVNPDGSRSQYGNSIPIDPVSGEYHTNELFGEVNVPVISPDMQIPLIYDVELQGAARYVRNSQTGGFWSYTYGGTYQPVQDLTFRGNYTRSFRAPAITEAYSPTGQIFDTANDPCDARYIAGGPNPARRAANCAAAGIPAGFTSNVVDFTEPGTSSGNPNLQNEIADSWTAGVVARPSFIPNLTLSADYIRIDITNEVASLGGTDLMNACYDSASIVGNPFCSDFTRDSSGQVTFLKEGYYNAAIEAFRAMQAEVKYTVDLETLGLPQGSGDLDFDVNYLLTFQHYSRVGTGDINYSVGTSTEPRHNLTINTTYRRGGFDFFWQTQFYGPSRQDVNQPLSTYQYPTVDPFVMFNASTGYEFENGFRAHLMMDNVFDTHMPFPYAGLSTTRYFEAIMGRSFRLNLGMKF